MLDELRIEEQMELLKRIARLTEQGKIDWKCEEYNPLAFMDEDKIEETSAYLCQMFRLTAHIDGLRVCPQFCVNTAGQCKIEQKYFKAGAAPAAAALPTK